MRILSPGARQVVDRTDAVSAVVARHTVRTPLQDFETASERCGARLLLKCEHLQRTGSFKVRGALAKVSRLDDEQRARGVVTASTGNHGLGVAYALATLGGTGFVCVPETASPVKVAAIRRTGTEVRVLGRGPGETELLARALAEELGCIYISPYNDLDVIAGQGTVGREIVEQLGDRELDAIVVSVGGGGLISGVASAVVSRLPHVRVVGASPANDAAMAACVRAGSVVEIDALPTISDGTAGGVEPGAITLPLCTELVDDWVLVREDAIHAALQFVIDTRHQLIEGAAATAVAAAIQHGEHNPGARIAVVSCGANISSAMLRKALDVQQ
jgi:threonine dehydratase